MFFSSFIFNLNDIHPLEKLKKLLRPLFPVRIPVFKFNQSTIVKQSLIEDINVNMRILIFQQPQDLLVNLLHS